MFRLHCSMAVLFAMILGGCGGGSSSDPTPTLDQGAVRLLLGQNTLPSFDSLVVHISASAMENRHFAYTALTEECILDDIPPGSDRNFKVQVYADGGQLVQQGEAVSDVAAGETIALTVVLQALAGFLQVEVPLGLGNSLGIARGTLTLSATGAADRTVAMLLENGKGSFATGALPLDVEFVLRVQLYNASGTVLYNGQRTVKLATLVQTETLTLTSTQGTARLQLQLASSKPAQILASLPSATRRVPAASAEVIFTELLPYPKTSGDDFEFMELYNTTLDTLELSGCSIARLRTSSGASARLELPAGFTLAPMAYGVLGRDSATFAPLRYQSFVLSNSGQSLVLYCGSVLLDSLYYSAATDTLNPFPLEAGKSLQLPLSNWQKRTLGSSWCAGTRALTMGALTVLSGPGLDAECL